MTALLVSRHCSQGDLIFCDQKDMQQETGRKNTCLVSESESESESEKLLPWGSHEGDESAVAVHKRPGEGAGQRVVVTEPLTLTHPADTREHRVLPEGLHHAQQHSLWRNRQQWKQESQNRWVAFIHSARHHLTRIMLSTQNKSINAGLCEEAM